MQHFVWLLGWGIQNFTRPDLSWLPAFPTRSTVKVAREASKTWRLLMWLARLLSHRCWVGRFLCIASVSLQTGLSCARWGLSWPFDLSARPSETSAGCEGMLVHRGHAGKAACFLLKSKKMICALQRPLMKCGSHCELQCDVGAWPWLNLEVYFQNPAPWQILMLYFIWHIKWTDTTQNNTTLKQQQQAHVLKPCCLGSRWTQFFDFDWHVNMMTSVKLERLILCNSPSRLTKLK